jgi:tetrahydromethanopterin S-methyltransferase subunit G
MAICPSCGEENPDKFRLCGFCGTPLAAELPPQEVRKTVTIVFSDLKGSTAMAEKLDSEAVREVMSRYFDEMREALERHGGKIEKYIGDAIMAVFGLPRVHEDDALRAVRAALEMRERLAVLNEELEQRWGITIGNRTGVSTGEVVDLCATPSTSSLWSLSSSRARQSVFPLTASSPCRQWSRWSGVTTAPSSAGSGSSASCSTSSTRPSPTSRAGWSRSSPRPAWASHA